MFPANRWNRARTDEDAERLLREHQPRGPGEEPPLRSWAAVRRWGPLLALLGFVVLAVLARVAGLT